MRRNLATMAGLALLFLAPANAGTTYGIAVGANSSAGSSGCSENAGYSTAAGGSYTTNSGFDNPDWTSCSLGSGGPSATLPGLLAASAQTSQSGTGLTLNVSSSASGAANLATGEMNLFADADAASTLIGMQGSSSASMWDTITVNGLTSTPTPVTITLTMDGTITGNLDADNEVLSLFVNQGAASGSGSGSGAGQCEWAIGTPTETSAYGCFNSSFTTYTLTDDSNYTTGQILVTISATMDLTNTDNEFGFFTGWSETANVFDCVGSESSGCGTTNTMNFLDTGAFSLSLPNGTTYTSASGEFLTEQGSEAPEPSTFMLLGISLAGLGAVGRVRKPKTVR